MTAADRPHHAASAADTEAFGEALARALEPGDLVLLVGDLASGKTTLVRGMLRGLGGEAEEVTSPTFVLVRSHPCSQGRVATLHHVDLYRVADSAAVLREVGLEELLSDADAVVAVEWPPDALPDWRPSGARCWRLSLTATATGGREITLEQVPNRTES